MRVLLIDDSPVWCARVSLGLQELDKKLQVDTADSLSLGLRLVQYEDYDLVLLDLNLGDSSEKETLKRFRCTYHGPLMIVSGRIKRDICTGDELFLSKSMAEDTELLLKSVRMAAGSGKTVKLKRKSVLPFIGSSALSALQLP